jgi:hypothetical protein
MLFDGQDQVTEAVGDVAKDEHGVLDPWPQGAFW